MRQHAGVFEEALQLDVLFELLHCLAHFWEESEHQSYRKLYILFYLANNKMEPNLEIINRFIGIISGGENINERLQTEWEYLHKLLRSQPVAFDRIEAYLNILQQQDPGKRKFSSRASSQSVHPEARQYKGAVDGLCELLADNDEKIRVIRRNEGL